MFCGENNVMILYKAKATEFAWDFEIQAPF